MGFRLGKLVPAFFLMGVGIIGGISRRHSQENDALQFVHGPSGTQTRNDAELLNGWLDQVENGWEVGKNHELVKSAFEPVVASVRMSTVQVFAKDDPVAMGIVVDSSGLIATKASEVQGKSSLICRLASGKRMKAKIAGTNERHDFALLRVNATDLTPVILDPNISVEIGTIVTTPSLEEKPVAIGIVGGKPSEISSDAVLGIRMAELNQKTIVSEVLVGSAAEAAGIKASDVIDSIDDKPVQRMRDAVAFIGQHLPGQTVRFLVERDGRKIEYSAKLGRFSDLDKENGDFQGYLGGELSDRRSGFPAVFQHDTFLLPRHCGGPLVDLQGRVVGMNIARAERIASYAIPTSLVSELVNELKNNLSSVASSAPKVGSTP